MRRIRWRGVEPGPIAAMLIGVSLALADPSLPDARRRSAELEIRRRSRLLQGVVLGGWGLGTIALAAALAWLAPSSGGNWMLDLVVSAAMAMTVLAPLGIWAGRVIKHRDADARMALLGHHELAQLDGLRPRLATLIADARLVQSAIEGRDFDAEVAIRSTWEWLQRLGDLPESDREHLERLGLADAGSRIAERLRWTLGDGEAVGHGDSGLAAIAAELGAFEQGVLGGQPGPYR